MFYAHTISPICIACICVIGMTGFVASYHILPALVLLAGYRANWAKPKLLGRLGLAGLGVFAAAGWWFGLMIWRLNRVAEMGWLGAAVPEEYGGAGFGRLERRSSCR